MTIRTGLLAIGLTAGLALAALAPASPALAQDLTRDGVANGVGERLDEQMMNRPWWLQVDHRWWHDDGDRRGRGDDRRWRDNRGPPPWWWWNNNNNNNWPGRWDNFPGRGHGPWWQNNDDWRWRNNNNNNNVPWWWRR